MRTRTIAVLAAGCALLAGVAGAQQAPAPYITVHFDTIDPAGLMEYEANNKKWVEVFDEAGVGAEYGWRAYDSGFTYAWVSDLPNFAYLDGNEAREKALQELVGKEKLDALYAGDAPITSHYTEIWKFEPELSYMVEGYDPMTAAAINVEYHHVRPSNREDYRGLVKEAIAAIGKVKAPTSFVAYTVSFGKPGFVYVTFGESRGALHSGKQMGELLNEALGEEASRELQGRWLDVVSGVEERDWRVRSELAYVPAPAGDADSE
jgi:hypothetical protein